MFLNDGKFSFKKQQKNNNKNMMIGGWNRGRTSPNSFDFITRYNCKYNYIEHNIILVNNFHV